MIRCLDARASRAVAVPPEAVRAELEQPMQQHDPLLIAALVVTSGGDATNARVALAVAATALESDESTTRIAAVRRCRLGLQRCTRSRIMFARACDASHENRRTGGGRARDGQAVRDIEKTFGTSF